MLLHAGRRIGHDVPACRACARRMRRERWLRLGVFVSVAVVGAAIAMAVLRPYRGPFRTHLGVAIAIACCLPWILWETFRPPAVDLTARSETVDYQFREVAYATLFAEANGATVV